MEKDEVVPPARSWLRRYLEFFADPHYQRAFQLDRNIYTHELENALAFIYDEAELDKSPEGALISGLLRNMSEVEHIKALTKAIDKVWDDIRVHHQPPVVLYFNHTGWVDIVKTASSMLEVFED
jgi:hypothetical protein